MNLCTNGTPVYCLDRAPSPDEEYEEAKKRVVPEWGGSLHYVQVDVTNTASLNASIESIAADNKRLDGLIAAAGIVEVMPAIEYTVEGVSRMVDINYTGLFMSATAAAREMMRYGCRGSICLVASMSGIVANKGMNSPAYNSSKAAVIQLARSLAMEWTPVQSDRCGGIRVNSLSPGHVMTPAVQEVFERNPGTREIWESENMAHRLANPAEFKSAALFLLSRASSFMTGSNLVIDGGHTAW